jgi:hypothetical protein
VDKDGEDGSEGGGEDVDEDNEGPIKNATTFSFSLSLSSQRTHMMTQCW